MFQLPKDWPAPLAYWLGSRKNPEMASVEVVKRRHARTDRPGNPGSHNNSSSTPAKTISAASTTNAAAAAQALINLSPFVAPSALSLSYNGGSSSGGGGGLNGGDNIASDTGNSNEDLSYLDFARIGSSNSSSGNNNSGSAAPGAFYRNSEANHQPQPQQQQQLQQQQGQTSMALDTHTSAFGPSLSGGAGTMGAGDVTTVSGRETDFLGSGGGGGGLGSQGPLTNEFFALDWPTCDGVYFFSEGRLFDI
ncbi:hypothetical protein Micbo1qcDRAFT_227645 [Microdochium bolleyi]|uniref:Uncharacterized protein n=1 Tax=Microdochium bolleyi TaxID=196109 RepID=A0A136IJ40_9PEZI|nr:hypothetical protein Micbo1qcDRAFT_227645 [Microdochium bolleyi]